MLLAIELYDFYKYLVPYRRNLVDYYKQTDSIINRMEVFMYTELSNANLHNDYLEKINKEEYLNNDSSVWTNKNEDRPNINQTGSGLNNLESMFWTIYQLNSNFFEENRNFLEIDLPLSCDKIFNRISEQFIEIIAYQLELISYLKSKRGTVNQVYLFNEN